MKNRELFERTFPELKARREQLERFSRSVSTTQAELGSPVIVARTIFDLVGY